MIYWNIMLTVKLLVLILFFLSFYTSHPNLFFDLYFVNNDKRFSSGTCWRQREKRVGILKVRNLRVVLGSWQYGKQDKFKKVFGNDALWTSQVSLSQVEAWKGKVKQMLEIMNVVCALWEKRVRGVSHEAAD